MRRVVVNNIVSLDGFYANAAGNPLVLEMDGAFDQANLDSISSADIVVLGGSSFDGMSAYWPFIADAPEPDGAQAPEAREFDDVNRAISRRYNELPKVVVSDRVAVPDENAWHDTTTIVPRADVAAWLETARSGGDGDILVFASHILWNAMIADGLVDELHLMISPTALGDGVPLFTEPVRLELLDVRRYEHSSNVQLRYAVASV